MNYKMSKLFIGSYGICLLLFYLHRFYFLQNHTTSFSKGRGHEQSAKHSYSFFMFHQGKPALFASFQYSAVCWQFLADAKSKHGIIWNLACTNWGQSGILMLLICLTSVSQRPLSHIWGISHDFFFYSAFLSFLFIVFLFFSPICWSERLDILLRLNASLEAIATPHVVLSTMIQCNRGKFISTINEALGKPHYLYV